LGIAICGVVISLWYYFGVIRAMYWGGQPTDLTPILISTPVRWALYGCIAALFWLGIAPNQILNLADLATRALKL
jgi:NADH:ubiquinone oxidoreductase subunit 2 (subunit N)